MAVWKRFKKDERGVTAMIFSLALLPALTVVGAAVDYARTVNVRGELQKAADATALQIVTTRKPGQSVDVNGLFGSNVTTRIATEAVKAAGVWNGGRPSFTVSASASVPTTVLSLFMPSVDVAVTATAEAQWRFTKTDIEGFNMSPEAADYNELYAYCYSKAGNRRLGPVDPASIPADGAAASLDGVRRLPFLKIADNSDAGVARRPQNLSVICGPGEVASYHLRNVRWARLDASKHGAEAVEHGRPCAQTVSWSARHGETWRHYTDSTMAENAGAGALPRFNTCYPNLVETIVCDRREACLTRALGGLLPDTMAKERLPAVASQACAPNKFIYFGWEDRPPGIGQWTDRDYDDIRLTVRCPTEINPSHGPARLTS